MAVILKNFVMFSYVKFDQRYMFIFPFELEGVLVDGFGIVLSKHITDGMHEVNGI